MARFVVDASATLPWCFADEATEWSESLLDRLRSGDQATVPAHWAVEVSNGMLVALRRGRIQPGRPELFWEELDILPIDVDPPLSSEQAKSVFAICSAHGLTVYDAVYLELAKRKRLPIASLDAELIKAARNENVLLIA
jgi:predicted nucleic acid-binding protein